MIKVRFDFYNKDTETLEFRYKTCLPLGLVNAAIGDDDLDELIGCFYPVTNEIIRYCERENPNLVGKFQNYIVFFIGD